MSAAFPDPPSTSLSTLTPLAIPRSRPSSAETAPTCRPRNPTRGSSPACATTAMSRTAVRNAVNVPGTTRDRWVISSEDHVRGVRRAMVLQRKGTCVSRASSSVARNGVRSEVESDESKDGAPGRTRGPSLSTSDLTPAPNQTARHEASISRSERSMARSVRRNALPQKLRRSRSVPHEDTPATRESITFLRWRDRVSGFPKTMPRDY